MTSSPYNLYLVATNDYPCRPIPVTSNVTAVTGITSTSFAMRVLTTFFLLSVLLLALL